MENNTGKLRIGVSGVGSIGFRHARLLSQRNDAELFLCDTTRLHLDAAAKLPNLSKSFELYDELLKCDLDGLIISTPDQFHIDQAENALRKGVPVLVEKPLAETPAQGEILFRCASETDVQVLVGYPLRYNAAFLKGKEIIDDGLIGQPVSFHVMLGAYNTLVAAKNRFNPSNRNKLFFDYSHEWDYIIWFLGKVQKVAAISHQSGELERTQNPNVVNSILEMKSGISGTAHLDYVQAPGAREFTIIGDKGRLVIDAVLGKVVVNIYQEEFERVFMTVEHFDLMMTRQHDHFFEVIRGDSLPKVTIEDGLNALRVADAMVVASETGTWIET